MRWKSDILDTVRKINKTQQTTSIEWMVGEKSKISMLCWERLIGKDKSWVDCVEDNSNPLRYLRFVIKTSDLIERIYLSHGPLILENKSWEHYHGFKVMFEKLRLIKKAEELE